MEIFFSLVSKRLATFFLSNNSIDTSVQKGGITGITGAHRIGDTAHHGGERGQRVVLWCDLTNAFGSIPHKLVGVALERHHIPQKVKDIILDY